MAASATRSATHRAIDAVWRIESAKIIAGLARMVRDVGLAEELAQEALVSALETWPGTGVPDNPGAWLMAAGKNRALDHFRRGKLLERKRSEEHTSELQSQFHLVCRLLLEKKKKQQNMSFPRQANTHNKHK